MRLQIPVTLRWADLDAYGHVNNVEALRLLEEARIAAFWRHGPGSTPTAVIESGPGAATHTFVAATEVEYLAPLGYHREPVIVELWIGHLGGASIDVCYRVLAPAEPRTPGAALTGSPVAPADLVAHVHARTTMVMVDAGTGRPRRLTDGERAAWLPYVEDPVVFRRRRR
ncbi:acyl-CoA thioesterase [Actinotalea sp. M2MS4P-6]|uniref:acyl-CoA thioesterase n=1 Tax=Actinotalea sp. M2MS4P-6 TaxID=2983762 RepID=UPI0021E40388|nr:thioesterase family protein [Actinotalea sp. M2MS4P-6]MCV2396211.1 acyl-CoA thioesterase [Actinotalea sp. M2MS4P-6]